MIEVQISNLQPCSAAVWGWKSRHAFYQKQINYIKLNKISRMK
jgi:hypothetical protein